MKNNIFGYVFVLFIIVIMGFAIYRVKFKTEIKIQKMVVAEPVVIKKFKKEKK